MNNKKLAQGAITTGAGTLLYTVPSGYKCRVTDINISNTTAATLTASLYLVPTGVAVGTTNMLFPASSVLANNLVQWTGDQILNEGDFIQGIGSGAGITVNISGEEYR